MGSVSCDMVPTISARMKKIPRRRVPADPEETMTRGGVRSEYQQTLCILRSQQMVSADSETEELLLQSPTVLHLPQYQVP